MDITGWSNEEIMKYTSDNIHLSKLGSDYLFNIIEQKINKLYEKNKLLVIIKDNDKKIIKNFYTMGVDDCYKNYTNNFYPTFYGCSKEYLENNLENIKTFVNNNKIKKYFIEDYFKIEWNNNNIIKYMNSNNDMSTSFNSFNIKQESILNFIQAGILLGFNKILLVGYENVNVDVIRKIYDNIEIYNKKEDVERELIYFE